MTDEFEIPRKFLSRVITRCRDEHTKKIKELYKELGISENFDIAWEEIT